MPPANNTRPSLTATGHLALQHFMPYRIAVLARGVSAALAKQYRSLGISIPEWRVIAHLAEVGTCSSGDICLRTEMDKAKVNRAVTRLVAAGLVLSSISDQDRRLNVLKLAAKGRRIYDQIVPIALEHQRSLMAALSDRERREFENMIEKLQAQAHRLWGSDLSMDDARED
ncbi:MULTISPECIES: MarR family winged helix-turn-helix transcriptional regulator [unclassified Beijerinckia]|uniref:MarR family winged helix-turn-helix transcriptional regulator n=1 Tax=unclassified Beijerinckia TaxID=2638183 RepID=UPI00089D4365|nr:MULTISPECIES: MarR family winged helix-turn-helix transcriptional regulator [unclassified Beijerinckia]MDH7799455.1 DNA-binding MarR family transcriptional regulator [Beijerinckia sp. GAS462]SED51056.1 DNA-binding transcriptional regulator, MarR family [Beijerinckia sp. 28-YEA-48]